MFSSLTGAVAALLPWTYTLSAPSSSRLLWRLHTPLAMPYKLVSVASCLPIYPSAVLQGQTSSLSWLRPGLGEDTIRTVAAIGRAIVHRSGSPDPSSTSKHLFGRLAIALWRGNACLWLHRHPSLPPSLDGIA